MKTLVNCVMKWVVSWYRLYKCVQNNTYVYTQNPFTRTFAWILAKSRGAPLLVNHLVMRVNIYVKMHTFETKKTKCNSLCTHKSRENAYFCVNKHTCANSDPGKCGLQVVQMCTKCVYLRLPQSGTPVSCTCTRASLHTVLNVTKRVSYVRMSQFVQDLAMFNCENRPNFVMCV